MHALLAASEMPLPRRLSSRRFSSMRSKAPPRDMLMPGPAPDRSPPRAAQTCWDVFQACTTNTRMQLARKEGHPTATGLQLICIQEPYNADDSAHTHAIRSH